MVWPDAIFSDLLTAHLPLSQFIHESLARWGQVPLWNPIMLAGQPLVGDPLAGLTYPVYWATYLLPSVETFQLLLFLHLGLAALGVFYLSLAMGRSRPASLAAAVSFGLAPRILGQWGLGHVTLVFALAWTPWMLFCLRKRVEASQLSGQATWRWSALAGGLLGLTFSIDPRWAVPAGMLGGAYGLFLHLSHSHDGERSWRLISGTLIAFVGSALLASAALALPLLQWLSRSTRAELGFSGASGGLPLESLAHLFWPLPTSWPEWNASLGIVVVMASVLGARTRSPEATFFIGTLVSALLLSLGDATPIYPLASRLVPGLRLLRIPARFFLLMPLACSLLVGMGIDELGIKASQVPSSRMRLLGIGLLASFLFFHLGLAIVTSGQSLIENPWAIVSLALGTIFVLIGPLAVVGPETGRSGAALLVVLFLELAMMHWALAEVRGHSLPRSRDLPQELVTDWGSERLFSPTYSISQDEAAALRLELIHGVSPLQLDRTWTFLSKSLGFNPEPYSVTLPPYPEGDPQLPPPLSYDLEELGLLNMRHVVSSVPLDEEDLDPKWRWRGDWIYENPLARPRAWMEPAAAANEEGDWWPAGNLDWTPNHIRVQASGPARLVLSEVHAEGWIVLVDGRQAQIEEVEGLLRSVLLDEGEHTVEFRFVPLAFYTGIAISCVFWVGLALRWKM